MPLPPKTLEDSVKDMLRPMLRQWLDENMPRVLTAALKDELKDELPPRGAGPRRLRAGTEVARRLTAKKATA